MRRLLLLIVLLLFAYPAWAADYYVSSNADLDAALIAHGGSNTYHLQPGIYAPLQIAAVYKGTVSTPTIIKSEFRWQATVDGTLNSALHAVSTADHADYVQFIGLEVKASAIDGVKVAGTGCVVRDCWVHDSTNQGISSHGYAGVVVEGNLVEKNGSRVRYDHGIYADGDGLTIRGNVVRNNKAVGLHLYPSLTNSAVMNNLVYGQTGDGGYGLTLYCGTVGGNTVEGNTIVDNLACINIVSPKAERIVGNILQSRQGISTIESNSASDWSAVQMNFNDYPVAPQISPNVHNLTRGPLEVVADPQFFDRTNHVYLLLSTSPCRGRGAIANAGL